jgi:type II secretory ATPase GspE/PulE/Tfp pilus assembly ATPase PilB-like protein
MLAPIVSRIKIMSKLDIAETRKPQDGKIRLKIENQDLDLRVSTFPTTHGENIVLRILEQSKVILGMGELGLDIELIKRFEQLIVKPYGMILVTGPTGAGKTTTLYAALNKINSIEKNIITIEDPVEYQMTLIRQTQVNAKAGLTFATGLRNILRQDPDVILVGEIRDGETASLAVNAALTGHLVLSTLHTNSAAGAVPRLIDMKVEPFLIVSTVSVVIGQRLIRKLAKEHKEKYFLTKAELDTLGKSVDLDRILAFLKAENIVEPKASWGDVPFWRPKAGVGEEAFSGRVGIHEVFKMSAAIRELIMKGSTAQDIETQAKKEGMMTMIEDGVFKAVEGVTTIEEVLRVVTE